MKRNKGDGKMSQHVKTYFGNLAFGLTKLTMTVVFGLLALMAVAGYFH